MMTTITGKLFNADGTVANGNACVSWVAFQTHGVTIVGGQKMVAIIEGDFAVDLFPNIAAFPRNMYYTVRMELDNGAVYEEYWIVPDQSAATIEQVRSTFPLEPGMAINPSQISGSGAETGMILSWNGAYWEGGWVTMDNVDPNWIRVGVSSTGDDVSVSGSPVDLGGEVTINIPSASATARGVVTTGAQTFAGDKNFSGAVNVTGLLTGYTISDIYSKLSAGAGFVPVTRQIIAGAGMTGGGYLVADVTLNAQMWSFNGRQGNVTLNTADIVAAGGVPATRGIIAGDGLLGGGALGADVTLSVAPGSSVQRIRVSKNGIAPAETMYLDFQDTNLIWSVVTPSVNGTGLSVTLPAESTTQRIRVLQDGFPIAQRGGLNLIPGANVSLTVTDNSPDVNVTIAVPTAGSGFVPATRRVIAGAGLTGGGPLTSDVTLSLGAGSGQTPWVQDITGAGHALWDAGTIECTRMVRIRPSAGGLCSLDFGGLSGASRWELSKDQTPESGGDTGSNLRIARYLDSNIPSNVMTLWRDTGQASFHYNVTVSGDVAATNYALVLGGAIQFGDGTVQRTAAVPQTPWLQHVNAAGFALLGASDVESDYVTVRNYLRLDNYLGVRGGGFWVWGNEDILKIHMDATVPIVEFDASLPDPNGRAIFYGQVHSINAGFMFPDSTVQMTAAAPASYYVNGAPVAQQPAVNFIAGANVTISGADNPTGSRVDVTVTALATGHVIQNAGIPLPQRAALNFTGPGVLVTDDSADGRTVVTISGGGGGTGGQTPWESDINAAGFSLRYTGQVEASAIAAAVGYDAASVVLYSALRQEPVFDAEAGWGYNDMLAPAPRLSFVYRWKEIYDGVEYPDESIVQLASQWGRLYVLNANPDLDADYPGSFADIELGSLAANDKVYADNGVRAYTTNDSGFGEGAGVVIRDVYTEEDIGTDLTYAPRLGFDWWRHSAVAQIGMDALGTVRTFGDHVSTWAPFEASLLHATVDGVKFPDGTIQVTAASGSGGAAQTPWTSNIDAAGFALNHVSGIGVGFAATALTGTGVYVDDNGIFTGFKQVHATAAGRAEMALQNDLGNGIRLTIFGSTAAGTPNQAQIRVDSAVTPLTILNGSSERIRMLPSGFTGFAITNPQYRIDASGDVNVTGTYRINGTPIATSQTPWTSNHNAAGYVLTNPSKVLINQTTDGGQALQVTGAGVFTVYVFAPNLLMSGAEVTPAQKFGVANNNATADYAGAAFECREVNYVKTVQNTLAYSPRLAFTWLNNKATQIGMDYAGTIRTFDQAGTGYAPFTAGVIECKTTGFKFPDGTSQATAYTDATTSKGDLLTRNATVRVRLPVGTDGQVLTADAASASGLKWAASGSGGAAQTPWTSNIDAANFSLNNTSMIRMNATGYFEAQQDRGFAVNLHFDGTDWRYIGTAPGLLMYAGNGGGGGALFVAPAGTAGAVATIEQRLTFTATNTSFGKNVSIAGDTNTSSLYLSADLYIANNSGAAGNYRIDGFTDELHFVFGAVTMFRISTAGHANLAGGLTAAGLQINGGAGVTGNITAGTFNTRAFATNGVPAPVSSIPIVSADGHMYLNGYYNTNNPDDDGSGVAAVYTCGPAPDKYIRRTAVARFSAYLTPSWSAIQGKPVWNSAPAEAIELARELCWKNFGVNHVIFDASNGTAPNGAGVSSTDSQNAWVASYPTLMGWNGSQTYGVRVDTARQAGNANTLSGLGIAGDQAWPTAWQILWCSSDGNIRLGNVVHVQGIINANGGINTPVINMMANGAEGGEIRLNNASNSTELIFDVDGTGNVRMYRQSVAGDATQWAFIIKTYNRPVFPRLGYGPKYNDNAGAIGGSLQVGELYCDPSGFVRARI